MGKGMVVEMKRSGKIRFKYYIVMLFLICIAFYNFCIGIYDGICYGNIESAAQVVAVQEAAGTGLRDNLAYLVIAIFISILFYSLMNRKLARPIEEMTEKMGKIAKGNLETRIATALPVEFQQMEQSFNRMAEELQKAEEEKQQQNKNNQQLYSNIAHDLKSPMTMVLGYAKALERGDVSGEEKQKEYLGTICEQAEHVNELLDVLLTYTRLENQAFQLKMEKNDLAEALRSCVAGYYHAFEEHGSLLEIDIMNESCMYSFDMTEMKRVFMNLLSNMIRHTEYGTPCKVEMKQRVCGKECIKICFSDQGEKVDSSIKDSLFEPFSVGDVSRNTKGGSGLGLSIARKIIERHQGHIYYEEYTDKKGKAFVIELLI